MKWLGLLLFIGGFILFGVAAEAQDTAIRLISAGFGIAVMIGGYQLIKGND